MRKTGLVSQIRKLQGISQSELAKRISVNPSSIARWEAGIPAIADGYISKACEILSIDKNFLTGESDYPFKPGAFIKFYVEGLPYRLRPLIWLDLLFEYTENFKILFLIKIDKGNVVAACAKDNRGSIFLVSIEVPLKWKEVFDYTKKYSDKKEKINIATEYFFGIQDELVFSKSFSYLLVEQSKEDIEKKIDQVFADILSDEERKLIELIRRKKIPIEPLFVSLSHSSPESLGKAIKSNK